MFGLMTLLAVSFAWAAYQINWIRQRHAYLAEIRAKPGYTEQLHSAELRKPITGLHGLWLFGEEGLTWLRMPIAKEAIQGYDDNGWPVIYESSRDAQLASRLFPEASCCPYHVVGTGDIQFMDNPQPDPK